MKKITSSDCSVFSCLSIAIGARAAYENDIEFAYACMLSLSQPCIVPCFQV
jgi:hypothetical protein